MFRLPFEIGFLLSREQYINMSPIHQQMPQTETPTNATIRLYLIQ